MIDNNREEAIKHFQSFVGVAKEVAAPENGAKKTIVFKLALEHLFLTERMTIQAQLQVGAAVSLRDEANKSIIPASVVRPS